MPETESNDSVPTINLDGKTEKDKKLDQRGGREVTEVERAVIGLLCNGESRTLDDISRAMPGDYFAQVFLTVDRMSREGLVRLVPECCSYRVSLADGGRML